ncbi:MAG: YibE/F family protein [Eubacterium sp.]|nr:YibE/F family protein [Eubacterium sp.]
MSVIFVLVVILLFLMTMIGENRGLKSFLILIVNFITFFVMIKFVTAGYDPVKVTVLASVIISSVTLFFINGLNKKTVSSFLSVIVVVLLTLLLTYKMGSAAKLHGFSNENPGSAAYLSYYVHINFSKLVTCEILLGLLGAIIDVSISIASPMNEVFSSNNSIDRYELIKSGINIGRDILGTMTNTLLFAYVSGFMTILLWFKITNYPFGDLINSKLFCPEIFQILCSGIGIVLIIPVTAIVTGMILSRSSVSA